MSGFLVEHGIATICNSYLEIDGWVVVLDLIDGWVVVLDLIDSWVIERIGCL
jgi:hypothetical protein